MRAVLRYALTSLATAAGVCGLARPATAQGPSPVVASFATGTSGRPDTSALALPHVVPPPQRLPTATDHILPVAAIAPKPALDLLAAPTVPSAWLTAPTLSAPAKLAVIPSGLPSAGVVKPTVAGQMVARPKIVPAVIVAPAPITVIARPTLQPITASKPKTRSWPPAYLVREEADTRGTQGVAYFETAESQAPTVVASPPAVK